MHLSACIHKLTAALVVIFLFPKYKVIIWYPGTPLLDKEISSGTPIKLPISVRQWVTILFHIDVNFQSFHHT